MIAKLSISLIIICLCCISCANIQSLSGGPEDSSPPVIVIEKSSENFRTNFNETEIVLTFNEWIRFENPGTNITISPTLEFPAEYKLKGKSLHIKFNKKEILKDNTTYTIQFGESIRDITNNNVQRELRYVFSTGTFIDSLQVKGIVLDAFTQKPKDRILVGLYKNLDDTAFIKTKPFYLSWTDTSGRFALNNLSAGDYHLFALEDKNQNYYFDQAAESVAFHSESLQLPEDSGKNYVLQIAVSAKNPIVKNRKNTPGESRLFFNEPQQTASIDCDAPAKIRYLHLKDSFLIWNLDSQEVQCILTFADVRDTFRVPGKKNLSQDSVRTIQLENPLLKPNEIPAFVFPVPIQGINNEAITISDTGIHIQEIIKDTIDTRKFYIKAAYKVDQQQRIIINENAVAGIHKTTNRTDTFLFRFLGNESLARLNLELDSLQSGMSYILQIISGDFITAHREFVSTAATKKLFFQNLLPGQYRVRVILDENKNHKWDPSDYKLKKQSEKIWYFNLPDLRADWDIDVNLKL